MDFALTGEQQLLQETLRGFAEAELRPHYTRWDRNREFPAEVWPRLGAVGAFGLRVPGALGGADLSYLEAGLAIEQIARGDFNVCYGMLNSCFAGDILSRFATQRLCETWLPAMAAGERIVSVMLTEPHCGSDAASIRTRAVRDGDHYVINGEKSAITLLMVADAGILFAKTARRRRRPASRPSFCLSTRLGCRGRPMTTWAQRASSAARCSSTTSACLPPT